MRLLTINVKSNNLGSMNLSERARNIKNNIFSYKIEPVDDAIGRFETELSEVQEQNYAAKKGLSSMGAIEGEGEDYYEAMEAAQRIEARYRRLRQLDFLNKLPRRVEVVFLGIKGKKEVVTQL